MCRLSAAALSEIPSMLEAHAKLQFLRMSLPARVLRVQLQGLPCSRKSSLCPLESTTACDFVCMVLIKLEGVSSIIIARTQTQPRAVREVAMSWCKPDTLLITRVDSVKQSPNSDQTKSNYSTLCAFGGITTHFTSCLSVSLRNGG